MEYNRYENKSRQDSRDKRPLVTEERIEKQDISKQPAIYFSPSIEER